MASTQPAESRDSKRNLTHFNPNSEVSLPDKQYYRLMAGCSPEMQTRAADGLHEAQNRRDSLTEEIIMEGNGKPEFDRVRRHTKPELLHKIDSEIEERIRYYATQPKEVISRRIEDLEHEWDIERWLETNASTLAFTGVVLGITSSKKWLLLSGGVLGFLFQHATQGWCPPISLLRNWGIRTQGEIDREKYALKFLRGDFESLGIDAERVKHTEASEIFDAVRS